MKSGLLGSRSDGGTALGSRVGRDDRNGRVLADARHTAKPWPLRACPERLACAVLDSLSMHVAVIDDSGTIIAVNRAWRDFSDAHGADDSRVGVGVNYLVVCDRAVGADAGQAVAFAAGLRDVLAGRRNEFALEYACHSPNRRRWYTARVTRLRDAGASRAVVAHEDITQRTLAEESRSEFESMLTVKAEKEVKLNAHLERRVRQLTALRKIDMAIVASADRRLTLGVVLEQAVEQLGVDAADVLLRDTRCGGFECVASRGLPVAAIGRACSPVEEGVTRRFRVEGRPSCVSDLRRLAPHDPRAAALVEAGFIFCAAVPLVCHHDVQGAMNVFCRTERDPSPEWFEFLDALAGQASIAIANAGSFEGLRRTNLELTAAYDATIGGWSRALDMRDRETDGHCRRVSEMTVRLARAMGMVSEELVHVRRGALLHDIGKMAIPDAILNKPGPLTAEEWVIMKQHPNDALKMLSPIIFLHPALAIPYSHHEKWDGTGYPRGLRGEEIPLAARIFAAVDIWDALGNDRPYHDAWEPARVAEHIRSLAGTHLDPRVVATFLPLIAPCAAARQ